MMNLNIRPKNRPARVFVGDGVRVRWSSAYAYLASLPQGCVTGKSVKAAAND